MLHPCVFSEDEPCDGDPLCLQNEVIVFSNFGHTVCHCVAGHYPLADTSLYSDLPKDTRCFKIGDNSICATGQSLWMKEDDSTHAECIEHIVPLSGINGGIRPNPCPPGQVKAFGICSRGRSG